MRALLTNKWTKAAVFVVCLMPLGALVWRGFNHGLGANPVEFIQLAAGDWTLRFLVITLSVTPFRKLLNLPDLIGFRRMLGLFAFSYLSIHFLTYLLLDQSFDFAAISKDVAKRPFITVEAQKAHGNERPLRNLEGCSEAAVHYRGLSGLPALTSHGDNFHRRVDPPPRGQTLA